jgi:hypothetical protein
MRPENEILTWRPSLGLSREHGRQFVRNMLMRGEMHLNVMVEVQNVIRAQGWGCNG